MTFALQEDKEIPPTDAFYDEDQTYLLWKGSLEANWEIQKFA